MIFPVLSGETELYPILGDPIAFVKSPQQLTASFAERGHNGICVPMQVPQALLGTVLLGLALVPNVRGLLITMPHKEAMFHLCSTASEISKLLGAVSIVRRNQDLSWHGDMLDGLSFVAAMVKQGAKIEGSRILQIGAGAAGSAIAIALLDAGARELVLCDSDSSKVERLIRLLCHRSRVIAGAPDPTGYDILVNATPLGMSPQDPVPVPIHQLSASIFVGDVVAGHGVTPLIRAARAAGCPTAEGAQMVTAGMDLMPDFLLGKL